jgi:hypothetical protein
MAKLSTINPQILKRKILRLITEILDAIAKLLFNPI